LFPGNRQRSKEDYLENEDHLLKDRANYFKPKNIFYGISKTAKPQRRLSSSRRTSSRRQRRLSSSRKFLPDVKEDLQNDSEDFNWSKNICKTSMKIFKMAVKIFKAPATIVKIDRRRKSNLCNTYLLPEKIVEASQKIFKTPVKISIGLKTFAKPQRRSSKCLRRSSA
jgi:hypothetical protein